MYENKSKKMTVLLLIGILGCILMAAGDFLMIYGDTSFSGNLPWLTNGAAGISAKNNLIAMALSFPAVVFYSIALFSLKQLIPNNQIKERYTYVTAIGMLPWLMLHLLYVIILFQFGWLNNNGFKDTALPLCEATFSHFSWLVPLSEIIMILPFLYLIYIFFADISILSRFMMFNSPIVILPILKFLLGFMKDSPLRLALTNGLMSESMIIFFVILIIGVNVSRRNF